MMAKSGEDVSRALPDMAAPVLRHKRTKSLIDAADIDAIGDVWTRLESCSDASFFQSWGWIGCWLRTLPKDRLPVPAIVRGRAQEIIALGLFGKSRKVRHGVVPSHGYYLNESGDAQHDCLTIEYNGLLAPRERLMEAATACVATLACDAKGWDELFVSGLDPVQRSAFETAARTERLGCRMLAERPCQFVDLNKVRVVGDYLEMLGKNTRYQVRRAIRIYEEDGPVSCASARSAVEALQYLDGLKSLHQAYWQTRGKPGAFANAFFERFHRALICERFAAGEIQLAKISTPKKVIGYLYNFIHNGSVYAYQSGFLYENDNRRKPGLVSHYLAIEGHLRSGARLYDFMAGEGQHKQNLSTDSRSLTWLVLQRDRFKFRVENTLRQWKHRLGQ